MTDVTRAEFDALLEEGATACGKLERRIIALEVNAARMEAESKTLRKAMTSLVNRGARGGGHKKNLGKGR